MMPNCAVFDWCETDHSEFDDIHERHIEVRVGDMEQDFLLELDHGVPRMEATLNVATVWIEPGEETDSFANLAEIMRRARAEYDRFVQQTRTLRRHPAVTEGLMVLDG